MEEKQERMVCTDELRKKLVKLGYKTSGYANELEEIITNLGFNLPKYHEDEFGTVRFGFRRRQYVEEYLNYADALAHELIFIYEHKLIEK